MTRHFDTAGAVTVTASLMLLVVPDADDERGLGLGTHDRRLGWIRHPDGGIHRHRDAPRSPLVPLSFFRRRTPTGANIIGFGLGTMVFGMFFLLSLYMQQVLGFSALKTGVGYLAVALTAVVASGAAQALVTKVGVKPVLSLGMLLLGGGLIFFTQVSVDGSYVSDLLPGSS